MAIPHVRTCLGAVRQLAVLPRRNQSQHGVNLKVFISWSGEESHKTALVLREWLPSVIQSITPYVSSEDIDKGTRWASDIAGELDESSFGILCVTKVGVKPT